MGVVAGAVNKPNQSAKEIVEEIASTIRALYYARSVFLATSKRVGRSLIAPSTTSDFEESPDSVLAGEAKIDLVE